MQPTQNVTPVSVYINPKFRSAHINPNFLKKNSNLQSSTSSSSSSSASASATVKATNIYINPKFKNAHINRNFLNKNRTNLPSPVDVTSEPSVLLVNSPNLHLESTITTTVPLLEHNRAPIVTKTKQKLVRQSLINRSIERKPVHIVPIAEPLIKIGKRKLIRAAAPKPLQLSAKKTITKLPKKAIRTKYKIVKGANYKIDRRSLTIPNVIVSAKSGFGLNLKNVWSGFSGMLTPKKVIITDRKLLRIGIPNRKLSTADLTKYKNISTLSTAKKLEFLNINGVLYKSTKNKLQKHESIAKSSNSIVKRQANGTKTLFVRGEKFILNANGNRLIRVMSQETSRLKRIDIGGLTYVAKSGDTYEQTNMHKTRIHLNAAKQKSINLLSKNRVKSNVPCPIFRKLGKCIGYERGRCTKVHDARHVAICSKFLKGSCTSGAKCLLSHNVSLSKMPTCKFYLQGMCAKEDCPYLHKKVNEKVEICPDFLKGYCEKAEKCERRHDFTMSDMRLSQNEKYFLKNKRQKPKHDKPMDSNAVDIEQSDRSRYFLDTQDNVANETNEEQKSLDVSLNTSQVDGSTSPDTNDVDIDQLIVTTVQRKRPKLGTLPSFIPLN